MKVCNTLVSYLQVVGIPRIIWQRDTLFTSFRAKFHRERVCASEGGGSKRRQQKENLEEKLLSARIWLSGGRPTPTRRRKKEGNDTPHYLKGDPGELPSSRMYLLWRAFTFFSLPSLFLSLFSPFPTAFHIHIYTYTHNVFTYFSKRGFFIRGPLSRRLRRSMKEELWFFVRRKMYERYIWAHDITLIHHFNYNYYLFLYAIKYYILYI